MTRRNRFFANLSGMTVKALLFCLGATATAHAATSLDVATPAADRPVEELVELEEIWVRGKLTAGRVVDTENRLYRLYNKLNTVRRYNIYCGFMRLSPNKMHMDRLCVPSFANYANPSGFGFRNTGGQGSFNAFATDAGWQGGAGSFATYSGWQGSSGSFGAVYVGQVRRGGSGWAALPSGVRQISPEERAGFSENVVRVIQGDPELLAMAQELIAMRREMDRVQAHFLRVQAEEIAAGKAPFWPRPELSQSMHRRFPK